MFFDKIASVARNSPESSDNDKESYFQLTGNMKINIQPANAEFTAMVGGALGLTFRGFTTYSGVEIGDRITVSGTTKQYIVKGKNDWMMNPIPHLELTLFLGDE